MDEKKKQRADERADPPAAPTAPASAANPAAAGDLDLAVEEIQRHELMKEGFVGQER